MNNLINSFLFIYLGFYLQTPLVYNFGDASPGASVKLHDALVSQLAEAVFKHFDKNPKGIYILGNFISSTFHLYI